MKTGCYICQKKLEFNLSELNCPDFELEKAFTTLPTINGKQGVAWIHRYILCDECSNYLDVHLENQREIKDIYKNICQSCHDRSILPENKKSKRESNFKCSIENCNGGF